MKRAFVVVVLVAWALAGCGSPKSISKESTGKASQSDTPAQALIKKSMDTYAALNSFSVESDWKYDAETGVALPVTERRIDYVKPNKFRLENRGPAVMIAQCDGNELIEYSATLKQGMKYPAPATIGASQSMQMGHFMFNGTLLYKFFEGSGGYSGLVDETKSKPTLLDKVPGVKGEKLQRVKFDSVGMYGGVEALIDEKTGIVHELIYDMAPLVEMMEAKGRPGSKLKTTERYHDFKLNPELPDSTFNKPIPKEIKLQEITAPRGTSDEAPFKPGDQAPEIRVTTLDGKATKLSELRGSPVLLDFWATWCGPCIEGLPVTEKLHKEFASKGLKVLTISDEDVDTIQKFIKEKNFSFPAFRDADGSANAAFKITGIPTMVVIDPSGKISSYSMGLEPEDVIRANLAKVGIK